MKLSHHGIFCAALSLALAAQVQFATALPKDSILCEGSYGGHVQGVATDGESIYWSFTVAIVKTDLKGHVLVTRKAPTHQGDLCYKDGLVYVAVNRGMFNFESSGTGMVTAYDAKTLEPVRTWMIPEVRHGAGGMTWRGDRFFVIGGLPSTHEFNYVYEYDKDFKFIRRHDLATGFTLMGIQTAAYENGRFLFGIYGGKGNHSGVLEVQDDLATFKRFDGPGSVGMLTLNGTLYVAGTSRTKEPGLNIGWIAPYPNLCSDENLHVLKKTGRGVVQFFFEGEDKGDWQDCYYALGGNGRFPLSEHNGAYVGEGKTPEIWPSIGIGGVREYSIPDLVRGVRRVAETAETLSIHIPGTPATYASDSKLAAAVDAIRREAAELGVTISGLK